MRARKGCAFQVVDLTARRQSFLALPPVRPLALLEPAKCNGRERLTSGARPFLPPIEYLSYRGKPRNAESRSALQKTRPLISASDTLFLRSFAPERKSTPVLSGACALFCINTGGGGGHFDYCYATTILVCPPASAARLSPIIDEDHAAKNRRRPQRPCPLISASCTLFVRSSAPERKSTPVLSSACALFCKKHRGWGWPFRLLLPDDDVCLSSGLGRPGCRCRSAGVNSCNPR